MSRKKVIDFKACSPREQKIIIKHLKNRYSSVSEYENIPDSVLVMAIKADITNLFGIGVLEEDLQLRIVKQLGCLPSALKEPTKKVTLEGMRLANRAAFLTSWVLLTILLTLIVVCSLLLPSMPTTNC